MHIPQILLLITVISINIFMLVLSYKKQRKLISGTLILAVSIGLAMLLTVICSMLVVKRNAAFVVFTIYYLLIFWYTFVNFRLSHKFLDIKKLNFLLSPLFYIYILISIALVYNLYRQLRFSDPVLFSLKHIEFWGDVYWLPDYKSLYIIMIIYNISVIVMAAISLLVGAIRTANVYRPKYLSIAVTYAIAVVMFFVSISSGVPAFISSLVYGIGQIGLIYVAVFYTSNVCVHNSLKFVADKLNDGIVLYDYKHNLLVATDNFISAFNIKDKTILENEEEYWNKILNSLVSSKGSFSTIQIDSEDEDDDPKFYSVDHMALTNRRKPIGTVYWIHDMTDTLHEYEDIEKKAHYDELTGIYNLRHFIDESINLFNDNPYEDFVMITSDVERFKSFKEHFGHEKADEYLKVSADSIRGYCSNFDACVFGRTGQDNFSVIMKKADFNEVDVLSGLKNICDKFKTPAFHLHAYIGVCDIDDKELFIRTFINRTLIAATAANEEGQRKIGYFDAEKQNILLREERYNAELSDAIEDGQIKMFLQPQVDNTGKLIGAEALARWIHPIDGIIPPANFIPFFEKNGRISEIDMCIWDQACNQLRKWKDMGKTDLFLSVNISPKDLYLLDIYKTFTDLAKKYDIAPKNLKLEITETAIISNLSHQLSIITKLQEAGFEVEMDDFGSAYSSFNMLKDICVDVLKIDMKFLGKTDNQKRSEAILNSIVTLSKNLNMKTVAEGVETEEQMAFLRSIGCELYQGFYFSQPIPVDEFEKNYIG